MSDIKKFFHRIWEVLKDSKKNFQQGEPVVYSAAIAFFTIFSLPAISIVVTMVASIFFSKEAARAKIVGQVTELIGSEAGEQVSTVLENMVDIPSGFWSITIGIVVVVQSASIMFFIIQKALNAVWNVRLKKNIGFTKMLKHRLGALAMVAGLGLLLIISLMLDFMISFFSDRLVDLMEENFNMAVRTINTIFFLTVVLVFFTTIHKVLPAAKISWKDAIAGGVITSVLFLIGKEVINYALTSIKLIGIYAAAGSLVVLLLWVFYSSIIFMLGAEVTKAYANNRGREIEPSEIAEKYSEVNKNKLD
ncbi:YihY/virulence factor BrkB family protein [Pontibacter locisalis]|uniref:YihY/virulence factor BrkB family protein n=1 Tax=Pontibacter locisalis TaxID=1719035 RepID=A0ABW5IMS6_9BACT